MLNEKELKHLKLFAKTIRLETLKSIRNLGFGHIGGAGSIIDTLAFLYGKEMNIDPKNPKWEDRDYLVCSKGHAGPAIYASLALKGYFPSEELNNLNKNGTILPSHCDRNLTPGIDMTTGSLGQGVSSAIGIALANRLNKKSSYTYLFIGDGELNEGQVWEGAMYASHQKLDNLIVFVDENKKQLDGRTDEISSLGDIRLKFEAFGFHSQRIKGNDIEAIEKAVNEAKNTKGKPSCIVLDTIKGEGYPFVMEKENNHHMRFTDEEFSLADELIEKLSKEIEAEGGVQKW